MDFPTFCSNNRLLLRRTSAASVAKERHSEGMRLVHSKLIDFYKYFFSRASTKLIPQDWSTSFNNITLFPGPTPRVGGSENFTINFYLYAPANYNGGFGTSNSAKGKPEDVKSPLENKQRKY